MLAKVSPAPSDCGLVGLAVSSCESSTSSQHANRDCLDIAGITYGSQDYVAPLTPKMAPIRRRPGEAILMDDLRRAREEIRSLREVLQRTQDERDKWKNRNHGMLAECYKIIKQHGLDSDLSLTTLQNLDTPAAVGRLEEHDRYMRNLFGKDSCDLAATVQNIVLEIQYVKTEMSGDTLRWRLCSALNLMQHISRRLQEACFRKSQDRGTKPYRPDLMSDTHLRSTLKSADVQLLSTLNEVRERGMVDYFQTFRKRFAPEYDMVHNECALEFYEKTKALMIRMYSQGRTTVKPQRRVEEIVLRDKLDEEEEIVETTWI